VFHDTASSVSQNNDAMHNALFSGPAHSSDQHVMSCMYLAHHELECVFVIIGTSAILTALVCHITCLQIWSGGKNTTKHKLTTLLGQCTATCRQVISNLSACLQLQLSSSRFSHIMFCPILFWHDASDGAGSSMDLVALLYEPADFEAQPKEASAGSTDPKMPESLAPNVLDALHGLSQQCIVFKKSAEQLGRHSLLCAYAALHE